MTRPRKDSELEEDEGPRRSGRYAQFLGGANGQGSGRDRSGAQRLKVCGRLADSDEDVSAVSWER